MLPPPAQPAALQRIINPTSVGTFLAEYWERHPLILTGSGDDFDDLLTKANIDELLSSAQIQPPNIRLMRAGSPVESPEYTSEMRQTEDARPTVDVGKVAAQFNEGATIVVQGLHRWWYALAVFCRQLEATLGHPAQANAYLTPPSAQGLPLHHDTHDVFALQLSGSKRWRIHPPTIALPLPYQWGESDEIPDEQAAFSLTLRKGDVLYLPRGWRHEAATSQDESFHLTIGIHAYTWMDALRDALLFCDDEVVLRRAVPLNGVSDNNLLDLLAARLDPTDVALRMRRRLVATRWPILHRQLGQIRDLAHLTTDTLVQRRPTVIADLEVIDNRPTLRFEGKQLVFPPEAGSAVRFCHRAAIPFLPADLEGLDVEGRTVLIHRLVLEGFLEVLELR